MDIYVIVLRLLHIFAGVFWVGAAWMFFFLVQPSVNATMPDSRKFLSYLIAQKRYPLLAAIAAATNVLAGVLLYARDSGGFQLRWIAAPSGLGFTAGALCAITAAVIGIFITRPAAERLVKLGQQIQAGGKPPSSEQAAALQTLQRTLGQSGVWVTVLVTVTLFAMAVSRYL